MKKKVIGSGIVIVSTAIVVAILLGVGGQQQAAIQGIPSDFTVVSISWVGGDVAEMEFVDHEPVITTLSNVS